MQARARQRSAFARIVRLEAHFFTRYPRMLLAALTVVLIPGLYVLIYLASVWDPVGKTAALKVALVNLDQGLVYRAQSFNVGRDLVERIKTKGTFGYQELSDEARVRDMVDQGRLAFALIVPADFSSNAIPGARAGGGRLVIYASEGNNLTGASLARHFAEELGREVNQSLNEQRWELVLEESSGSERSLTRLQEGVQELLGGARELSSASTTLAGKTSDLAGASVSLGQGVGELVAGSRSLSAGLWALHDKRPRDSDLRRLDDASKSLNKGLFELGTGLGDLQLGLDGLQSGIGDFKAQALGKTGVPAEVGVGLQTLGDGVSRAQAGAQSLGKGQRQLSTGATEMGTAVGSLTAGARAMNSAMGDMVVRLPRDVRLSELVQGSDRVSSGAQALSTGAAQLAQGAQHLSGGIELLSTSLPPLPPHLEGNAQGLASSVLPVVEMAAPVQNNGSGFAPNIIPGALWLGASMAAFLFRLRDLPRSVRPASAWVKMGGKILLPLGLGLTQAIVVGLCLTVLLSIRVFDGVGLALTLLITSVAFLMLVFAMTRAFGDVGKALALILLVVQLSSSGGVLPVELSGGIFAAISDYLPMTWVVKALKASLFGAFGGDWLQPLQSLLLLALLAMAVAVWLGRWRYVPAAALRPALDI